MQIRIKLVLMSINEFLSRVESKWYNPWLNIIATIYLNFRLCKFKDAIHLPIYFYGRVFLDCTMGRFEFPNGVHAGMVRFGINAGHFSAPKGRTYLEFKEESKVIVHGNCLFCIDTSLRLTMGAVLELSDKVRIGDSVKIMCENYIFIGENSVAAFDSQIIDTNFHYIEDLETGEISRKNQPVIIGSNNWIGNRTSVMKGTHTPDWCIVGSGSILNKDYGNESYCIIAGAPAKIVRKGRKRIFDLSLEYAVDEMFQNNNLPSINSSDICLGK